MCILHAHMYSEAKLSVCILCLFSLVYDIAACCFGVALVALGMLSISTSHECIYDLLGQNSNRLISTIRPRRMEMMDN